MKLYPYVMMLAVFFFWSNIVLTKSHELDLNELYQQITDLTSNGTMSETDVGSNLLRMLEADTNTNAELFELYHTLTVAEKYRKADVVMCCVLMVCSAWFMITEIDAFIHDPKEYLFVDSIENTLDLIPLILLFVNTMWSISDPGKIATGFWVI